MDHKIIDIFTPKLVDDLMQGVTYIENNSFIAQMIAKKKMFSLIFYGPTGCGKTTVSKVLCNQLNLQYEIFNSTVDNKQKLIQLLENNFIDVIIVDEIHRLNKDKQDILLPYLNDNTKPKKILATTTENPFFYINPAIRSRCHLIQIPSFSTEQTIEYVYQKLITHDIKLLTKQNVSQICRRLGNDIRSIIAIIDALYNLYDDTPITSQIIDTLLLTKSTTIANKGGDNIHDLKSAFHKSMRGSDVDASLHYLACLIKLQDLQTIERRIIACAYEDVGFANINLILRVTNSLNAAKLMGFPEAINILAACVIEIALSPKSNSICNAITKALIDVENQTYEIPFHLRDSHYKSASKLNVKGYIYPLDYEDGYVVQNYLPNKLKNKIYFKPNLQNPAEMKLVEWITKIKSKHNLN